MDADTVTALLFGVLLGIIVGNAVPILFAKPKPTWPTGDPAIDLAWWEFMTAPREEDEPQLIGREDIDRYHRQSGTNTRDIESW